MLVHEIDDVKGFQKWEFDLMKKCATVWADLITTTSTLACLSEFSFVCSNEFGHTFHRRIPQATLNQPNNLYRLGHRGIFFENQKDLNFRSVFPYLGMFSVVLIIYKILKNSGLT